MGVDFVESAKELQLWSGQALIKHNQSTVTIKTFSTVVLILIFYSLKQRDVIENYTKPSHPWSFSCFFFPLSWNPTQGRKSHLRSRTEYLFSFWARKGRIKLTLSYHSICLPLAEEKQDYSISLAPKRQTIWIPSFHCAPTDFNCFLCLVFTSDSYGFVFFTWQWYCKPDLCQVKFIFLMSLILRFLICWSCLKHFIIFKDSIFPTEVLK